MFFSNDKQQLKELVRLVALFLEDRLQLKLHPHKVSLETCASGIDFLGWVHFPDHRVLRTVTKRRMLKNVAGTENEAVVDSYLGLLRHGNARKLYQVVLKNKQ